ncbi:hypothetical protein I308_101694 [Cryptococcus tetragattii IND107]|uniref:Carboxylesterase type B domain-containing protein n=1 Tax=Cryptococcus tetragattii IND107 TaxID=1296105 RepID=A0ABR3BV94_9TREE|nr:hypothetical protein I308_02556 [Cryptococcus tetragattii IND107]
MLLFLLLSFPSLLFVTSSAITRTSTSGCSKTILDFTATGYKTSDGTCRYTVRYGKADRWVDSVLATDYRNQTFNSLPPSCPQDPGTYVAGSGQSEDCLFATVYIPQGDAPTSGWPTFVWIHGGSFTQGGASAPGLDGSKLAVKGDMIVVVLQYRLGVLGFLPPTSASTTNDPNLGLKDVILGLKAINQYIEYAGGNRAKVTIGGQSSGAGLIRALWGAPAAAGSFRAAILQSDPMSYGFASHNITTNIQSAFYSTSPMSSCSTLECLKNIHVSTLIAAQDTIVATAPFTVWGVPFSEPIRPTWGTATLPADPISSLFNSLSDLTFTPSSLPLLITTVKNEGGSAISSLFPTHVPLSNDTYYATAAALVGTDRAAALVSSPYYALPSTNSSDSYGPDGDTFRETFERAVTDGTWKCPNRDAALKWKEAGGKIWVGEWTQGVSYPDNDSGYCQKTAVVCHEDDIYPTFGTAASTSTSTLDFEKTILSHWVAFITTLNPNPSSSSTKRACDIPTQSSHDSHNTYDSHGHGSNWWERFYTQWEEYNSQTDVYSIGGDSKTSLCPDGFWGVDAKYDWQLYG